MTTPHKLLNLISKASSRRGFITFDVLQRIEDPYIVSPPGKTPLRNDSACGVHADGRTDYMDANAGVTLRAEETKLDRRIDLFCHPKNLLGYLIIAFRRWRLLRMLRVRFEVPYAMFVAQDRTHDEGRPYDPLNDYGLGRATIPTSIGGGLVKSIIGIFRK